MKDTSHRAQAVTPAQAKTTYTGEDPAKVHPEHDPHLVPPAPTEPPSDEAQGARKSKKTA